MNLPTYLPPLRLTGESAALTLETIEVAMEEGHCENDPALADVCNLLRAGLGLEYKVYPADIAGLPGASDDDLFLDEPGNTPLDDYLAQAEEVLSMARASARHGQVSPALIEHVAEAGATFSDLIYEAWFPDLTRAKELYGELRNEYLRLTRQARGRAA